MSRGSGPQDPAWDTSLPALPRGWGEGAGWRGTVLNLWAPPRAPHCLEGGCNPPSLAEALGRPRPPTDPAEEGVGRRDPWPGTCSPTFASPAWGPGGAGLPSGKIPEEEGESPASWPHLGSGWGCFHGFRLPAPEASSPTASYVGPAPHSLRTQKETHGAARAQNVSCAWGTLPPVGRTPTQAGQAPSAGWLIRAHGPPHPGVSGAHTDSQPVPTLKAAP